MRLRLVILLVMALLATACTSGGVPDDSAVVEGVLLRVESSSLTQVDTILLRDDAGAEWSFSVTPETSGAEGEPKPTPGHLRQHMASGDRMLVQYLVTPEGRVATQIAH